MPRYHTNLAPTIEGWVSSKNEVSILTYTRGRNEDYSNIESVVVGYAKVFNAFYSLYVNIIKKNDPLAKNIALKIGIPPIKRTKDMILKFSPDIVILREKNLYSIVCTAICRALRIKTILYNQSPLFNYQEKLNRDFIHRIVDKLTPTKRITPVYKIGDSDIGLVRDKNAIFAPFVMPVSVAPSEKKYFKNGNINILEIGKYEKRKNHLMMIDVFEKLSIGRNDLKLTIVGEKSDGFQENYYQNLLQEIMKRGLLDKVTLKYNLSRQEIYEEYKNTDIFVLPSTGEPAAISHIEAMSYSIPAISSSGNGTADYIINSVTGYIFEDNCEEDLQNKLSILVNSKEKLVDMGKNAYARIDSYCNFRRYQEAVQSLL